MNSAVVFFLLAISLAIYQASAVPTCYITIAGALKFGFFAPYNDVKWREVKENGNWGVDTLKKWRDRVIISFKGVSSYSSAGLSYNWKYDAATECIVTGSVDRGSGYVQRPRTYAIVHPKNLPFRVKSNGILTSDKGYVNSQGVKVNQFEDFFKHYHPDVDGPYAGFYWSYYGNLLYFAKVGGKLHIEKKEGAKYLYFYGIFEKPNEFLLPGSYSDRKLLGKVDSAKACVELAKRSLKPDLTFIKAISHNGDTNKCYYCNKEGDTRNRVTGWAWSSADVNLSLPECFLYVYSSGDDLYDSYAPWGYKEWRSVDNNDKWSDHYIRLENSKFYIFKEDVKLIDKPITHSDGLVWDNGAKCIKKSSQITGHKNPVYVYTQNEFGVYLTDEPAKRHWAFDSRWEDNAIANLQKRIDQEYKDPLYDAVVCNEENPNIFLRYSLYTPGAATKGVVTMRFARPPRQTPQRPATDLIETEV